MLINEIVATMYFATEPVEMKIRMTDKQSIHYTQGVDIDALLCYSNGQNIFPRGQEINYGDWSIGISYSTPLDDLNIVSNRAPFTKMCCLGIRSYDRQLSNNSRVSNLLWHTVLLSSFCPNFLRNSGQPPIDVQFDMAMSHVKTIRESYFNFLMYEAESVPRDTYTVLNYAPAIKGSGVYVVKNELTDGYLIINRETTVTSISLTTDEHDNQLIQILKHLGIQSKSDINICRIVVLDPNLL